LPSIAFFEGEKPMNGKKSSKISRREFARRAALASAAATIAPGDLLSSQAAKPLPPAQQPPALPKLSPEGQAEVEARVQAILGQYGSRFTDAQKTDLRRLCTLAQPALDRLRAYTIENGDAPALYLKPLVERETKHVMPWAAKPIAPASDTAPGATPAKPAASAAKPAAPAKKD
jgi:hypothetical protein